MMAIFMPTDFKSLSINNFLKLQYPTQALAAAAATHENPFKSHLNIGAIESANAPMLSNVAGLTSPPTSTATNPAMLMTTDASEQHLKVRLCSDDDSNSNDSDLSVGQEKVLAEANNNNNNGGGVNVKEPVSSDDDGDEEMSNASSSQYTNSSTRLCSPQNSSAEIMTRPMHFHEEILRSSQLYAEEILRQRIAAAARLQSVAGVDPKSVLPDEPEPSIISKLSFQTSMFSTSAAAAAGKPSSESNGVAENGGSNNGGNLFCAKSAINFQNIHSHLSAISQITHNLGGNLKRDDATSVSSLSRESSQSPSGFQQFKHHQKHHGFHTTSAIHQNQFHDHSLKFSIDNILKADFGRRITEPLLKTSRLKRGKHEKEKNKFTDLETRQQQQHHQQQQQQQKEPHNSSSTVTKDKSLDQSYSSSADTSKSDNAGTSGSSAPGSSSGGTVWPAWVFCTRYSDRPSSGRSPRIKKKKTPSETSSTKDDEKRPRTAFSGAQLARLKHEFNENRYLTEKRRQQLSAELGLNEAQIKIWFQNKRAKIKKSSGTKNPLALQLMAQGLYNHSTVPLSKEEEELQELQSGN